MPTLDEKILNWRWWIGLPADFWVTNEPIVERFIEKNRLAPVHHEALRVDAMPLSASSRTKKINPEYIINIRGGRKTPHLHYKGEIYFLNAKQWQAFSTPLIKEFGKRLANTNSIGFETFMEISESINEM